MLSGVMMFDFLGWHEAARLIENSMEKTIQQKYVTYDFERQMQGATKVKTSEFATRMIENMDAKLHSQAMAEVGPPYTN
jgi:isocitrate dehydrogenase